MFKNLDPKDHYWLREDGVLYSSARQSVVPPGDTDYLLWVDQEKPLGGGTPSWWPRDEAGQQTEAALQAAIAHYGLFVGLTARKEALKASVDATAETLRQMLVTTGSGQAMEYQEAQRQALAALAAPETATGELYPMLAASIGLDRDPQTGQPAADVLGVARAIKAAFDLWLLAGAAIRRARLTGKAAIEDATTASAAEAAFAGIAWPALG